MLRYLRENTGNWIIKIFLGIIVVVFVFLGVGSLGSKRNDLVATINDEPITRVEYQQAYKTILSQLQARFGRNLNDDIIKALNLKQQAIDALIEQKLLLSEAEKLEIVVSKEELQNYLISNKAFQKNGLFDMAQYKRVLGLNSTNPEIFEQNKIQDLMVEKVRRMVNSTVNVSDNEAKLFYLFQNTKVAVDYLAFTPSSYTDIKPTREQIQDFYDKNKENYMSESKRKVIYLKFSPADYKDQVEVLQEDIQDYYDQNIETFETPEKIEARHILIKLDPEADSVTTAMAENKAMDIYKKAAEGEDFETLAKQFSEGPSRDSGGYLGTFEKSSMVKPFADAAFAMKAGDISEPVKTQFGLHIIKVVAKFDASIQTLAQVSKKIKLILEQDDMQNIAYDRAGEAFDAVIDGDDFEQVALISDKKIIKTDAFDQNGKGLIIPNKKEFAQTAFALAAEDTSDVKQLGDSYYLIKIIERIVPAIQTLDIVKADVQKNVTSKLQKEFAQKQAQEFLDKAVAQNSLEDLSLPDQIKIKSTPLFTRNGSIEGILNANEFIQAGFTLNDTQKIYPRLVETSTGYYILKFKEKKEPAGTEVIKNLKTVKDELVWKKQTQSYQAWLMQLKKTKKIKYDPAFLN
ncbi:MAG: SurA N-terminal domain-containing protein [Desulfobacula sp.]|nr:SurA N-terminal domain-containing protein [Desulfobacula sp.]